MSWHTTTLLAFDLETTGTDTEYSRIVTAAALLIEVTTGTVQSRTWLADSGIDIPDEATAIHGITTEHTRTHGHDPALVAGEITTELATAWNAGAIVVAFNAVFDLTILDRELRRHTPHHHGLSELGPVIDPLVLDRAVDRYRPGKRRLADCCTHYGIALPGTEAHTSYGDALATARLAWCLAERYPHLANMSTAELHAFQQRAHRAWAENFQHWLRQRKAADGATEEQIQAVVINPEWPLHPHAEVTTDRRAAA